MEIVTFLLDRGAAINLTSSECGTALGVAAYWGKLEIVTLLLDRGVDPDLTNSEGERPQDLARQEGHRDIADFLASYDRRKCMPNWNSYSYQLPPIGVGHHSRYVGPR